MSYYYHNTLKIKLFTAFSSISFFIVGVGIVLPAWVAFHFGGSSLVGLVLLSSSVSGLVLAPIAGYLVDRHDRSKITAIGQIIRALGLVILASIEFIAEPLIPALLIISSVLGAFGFALLSGSLNGILQAIVPEHKRMRFAIQRSLFNQLGIAIGTGVAGFAIEWFGSLASALVFATTALASLPLLKIIMANISDTRKSQRLSLLPASQEAFRYLLSNPLALSAAITVGMAYAVIQITNLLLPGFVNHFLDGDSRLFGLLEMISAIAGIFALAVAGFTSIVKRLQELTLWILGTAAVSLLLFALSRTPVIALFLYCIAGMLWNISRAAANGHLLTLVDQSMIGRVQAFTTLLTNGFGFAIYLLPLLASRASEANLYMACSLTVVICVCGLAFWVKYKKHK